MSVGFRKEAARAAAAVRTGLKGERNTSPGSGGEEHPSGSEERRGDGYKTPRWAAGSPSHCEQRFGAPIGAPLPLSYYRETEKKTRRCAPVSVERGGGAMAS